MRKKRFFRKQIIYFNKHKILILIFLAFLSAGLIIFNKFFFFNNNFEKSKINSPLITNKKIFEIPDSEYKYQLINHIKTLFDIIWNNCKDSNEIKINQKKTTKYECFHKNNMLLLLLLESLETLYISNEYDLFQKASNFIKQNLNFENFDWIDIRDFWTRFIASLIGIFQISDDHDFLDIALKASKEFIQISNKYSFPMSKINFKTKEMKQYSYMQKKKAVDLSDSSCGLPEIIELYKLTEDFDFYLQYSKQISEIPTNITTPLSSFYHQNTRIGLQKLLEATGSVNDFYSDIQIANDLKEIKFFTNFIESTINYTERKDFASFMQWSLFVERAKKNGILIDENKYKSTRELALKNIPPFFHKLFEYAFIKAFQLPCFKFEMDSLLFYQIYNENLGKVIEMNDFMEKLLAPLKDGYDNNCILLNGEPHRTGIITSNVLGQWLKLGLLFLSNTKAILNQNGHILEVISLS